MTTAAQTAATLPKKPTRKVSHIPGDSGPPIIGYTFDFLNDFKGLVRNKYNQYGDVFRYNAIFQNVINLVGPDANEFVLKDQDKNFSSKLAWDSVLEELFPNGLMLRDFENHKYHRKILQAAFKKPAMQGYVNRMNPAIAAGIKNWPTHKEFLFFDHIKELLLSTGADLFLGVEMGRDAEKVNKSFIAAVDASLAVLRVNIPGTTWHRGMKGRRFLEDFIGNLVAQKRVSNTNDFFTQICHAEGENGEKLSDQEVIDHMIFLLFAAHDTTTSTLTSLLYELAINTEWQDIVREEMQSFNQSEVTYEDLQNMEKTTWVFKETLRMHPALPTIPRRTVRDCEFKGYKIPKNSSVGIHPYFTHYMEEYWTNPYTFDPVRWSPERAEYKKHFFQYVPFGGGAHKCLGLNFAEIQSKVFLFQFLTHYKISVKPGYAMDVQLVPIAMPRDGFPVTIEPI